MDRSSIGFESWRSHRGLRSRSPADVHDNRAYGGVDSAIEVVFAPIAGLAHGARAGLLALGWALHGVAGATPLDFGEVHPESSTTW